MPVVRGRARDSCVCPAAPKHWTGTPDSAVSSALNGKSVADRICHRSAGHCGLWRREISIREKGVGSPMARLAELGTGDREYPLGLAELAGQIAAHAHEVALGPKSARGQLPLEQGMAINEVEQNRPSRAIE